MGTSPAAAKLKTRSVAMTKCLTTLIIALFQCQAADLALVGAKIYPSPTEPAIENGLILVHDGRIVLVGRASVVKIPYETEIIRCSGMVVTAYLMHEHGWPRDQALAFAQSKRPQFSPNPTLMRFLLEWEQALKTGKT